MSRHRYRDLNPEDIFADARLDGSSEQRIEQPLTKSSFVIPAALAVLVVSALLVQTFRISVMQHDMYSTQAEKNKTERRTIIAERGAILDRNGVALAKNTATTSTTTAEALREYPFGPALAQLLGYVSYPKRDTKGVLYQSETIGIAGIEKVYNTRLAGVNGALVLESDARGESRSGAIIEQPQAGPPLTLSIDAKLQKEMFALLKERVDAAYKGGAAAIMDITNGELVVLASYPSYDPEVMSLGYPKKEVERYMNDPRSPFVDRAVSGLYAPGSIVKPFVALAALHEGTVSPERTFVSTGKLVVPNPYNPDKPSVFKDWKAHGAVDMRKSIAVSSDVYFYIVGGGFQDHKGLGITKIDEHAKRFGFGEHTGYADDAEPQGVIPTPEWKADKFNGDEWRVGDTYISAIGQFGWQVTLLQSVRATAALANGGKLVTPTVIKGDVGPIKQLPYSAAHLKIIKEGMRMTVTEGTAQALSIPGFRVAAKTGTAEVGEKKDYTNSLVVGFFPYDEPRYAFAVILEHAKAGTTFGAPAVMGKALAWIKENAPEYTTTSKAD